MDVGLREGPDRAEASISPAGSKPKRQHSASRAIGRRPGSVKLSTDIERTILSYIEAGAFDYVAAEAAGIDERTFRDWMARGEGRHPTRIRTRELTEFASRVREAKARARASREIVVADKDPRFWLAHAARSKPGREGWTDPIEALADGVDEAAPYEPTADELAETLRALLDAGVVEISPCGDPACRCARHVGKGDDGADG
jgi:hypothetical protein